MGTLPPLLLIPLRNVDILGIIVNLSLFLTNQAPRLTTESGNGYMTSTLALMGTMSMCSQLTATKEIILSPNLGPFFGVHSPRTPISPDALEHSKLLGAAYQLL